MSQVPRMSAILFWFMAVMAFAALAPCLILPPWLEYQDALHTRAARRMQEARLASAIAAQDKQIEHLRHDVAYNERVLSEEVGLQPPGVRTILVDHAGAEPDARPAKSPRPAEGDIAPGLTKAAQYALSRYPEWTQVFVREQTRPLIMTMAVVLLVSAVLLLGGRKRDRPATSR